MSRRSLIGSPAWTTLKDVGNLLVNDDQAEEAARRMSVYPIKGGLGGCPNHPFQKSIGIGCSSARIDQCHSWRRSKNAAPVASR